MGNAEKQGQWSLQWRSRRTCTIWSYEQRVKARVSPHIPPMSANYDITRAVGPSDIMKIRKAHKRYFGSQLVELLLFFFLLRFHCCSSFTMLPTFPRSAQRSHTNCSLGSEKKSYFAHARSEPATERKGPRHTTLECAYSQLGFKRLDTTRWT